MKSSIRTIRIFVATMIAAMVLSIAAPPRGTKAADDLARIDDLFFRYEKGHTVLFNWSLWTTRGDTTKMRIYRWLEADPDPDLSGLSYEAINVGNNLHTFIADTPGIYEFAFVGVDASGMQTTEPKIITPVDLRAPYGTVTSPFNGQSPSRSIEIIGSAPTCVGCELFIRVENATDNNSLYGEYQVLPEEWPTDNFKKTITLANDAPSGQYNFFAVFKQAGNTTINRTRYGNIELQESEPFIDMQYSVNKYDLTVSWTESNHPAYAYSMIKIKRPGTGFYGDVEQVNKVGPVSTYTYANLWSGNHEVNVTTYDSNNNAIATNTLFVTIGRDGPPAIWTLRLQDAGHDSTLYSVARLSFTGPFDNDYDKFRIYFKRSDGQYDDKYSEVARAKSWNGDVDFDFGLPPIGSYTAKVVTVDRDGTESAPIELEDISFTRGYKPVNIAADHQNTIYRNKNTFTVSGQHLFHYFTEIQIDYLKNGVVEGTVTADIWNRNNGQFSATVTLPQGDTDDYTVQAFLYEPVTKLRSAWGNFAVVKYDSTLPHLPTGIQYTVQNNNVVVDWDHPEAPDYDSVELILRDKEGTQVAAVTIPKENNTHTFADLDNGIYTVSLTTVNANGRSPDTHSSGNLSIMGLPVPALDGEPQITINSGKITVSGSSELCFSCQIVVSIYDANRILLEEIIATNWTPETDAFSVTSGTDRPNGTYLVTARIRLEGYPDGPESAFKTFVVAKSVPPSSGGGGIGGGGGGGTPVTNPVTAPAPDANEIYFYLTPEASEHDGFKRSIRLSVDKLAVDQDTSVKVRKLGASSLTLPSGYSAHSDAFALSSDKPINKPPRLTLRYSSATLKGANPEKLGIYRQSESDKNVWKYVGGVVNKENNSITALLAHPGTYAAFLYEKSYQDLGGHWSKNEVETLASRQLVDGVTAQSFDPDRAVTRAEAVKMLIEMMQYHESISLKPKAGPVSINDVSSSAWYYDYVMKAASLGIIDGDGGAFLPDHPITREEFAEMIFRMNPGNSTNDYKLPEFKDGSSISTWAKQAVAFATHHGILQGSGNRLNPQGQMTRSQAAAIVLRTMRLWEMIATDDPVTAGSLDATIYDASGKPIGWAVLTPQQDGVRLQLKATGLKPGKHGFHIHEKGFTWLDFKSAGGHFNPDTKKHGHDNPQGHHLGDMPNLIAKEDGSASVDMVMKGVSLSASGAGSFLGRSIIIHAAEDDYKSDPAGNAGDRIAGGNIIE